MTDVADTSVLTAPYAGLLAKARSAFSADPSYAIAMAQQAHIVRARRAPTERREEEEAD